MFALLCPLERFLAKSPPAVERHNCGQILQLFVFLSAHLETVKLSQLGNVLKYKLMKSVIYKSACQIQQCEEIFNLRVFSWKNYVKLYLRTVRTYLSNVFGTSNAKFVSVFVILNHVR